MKNFPRPLPRELVEPSVAQEVTDRTSQRVKLEAFFKAHPNTIFSQETLAHASGADLGAVRTRISELKIAGLSLRGHLGNYRDDRGVFHRGKKRWEFIPRPEGALGRDAGDRLAQKTLFG